VLTTISAAHSLLCVARAYVEVQQHLARAKQRANEYSNNVFGFAMIPEIAHDNEPLSLRMSVAWLAVITLFVALLSEALVSAHHPPPATPSPDEPAASICHTKTPHN